MNLFHHLSYEGAVDIDSISDSVEKQATIGIINNFGQSKWLIDLLKSKLPANYSKNHIQKETL